MVRKRSIQPGMRPGTLRASSPSSTHCRAKPAMSILSPTSGSASVANQPISAGKTLQTKSVPRGALAEACTASPHHKAPTKLRMMAPYIMSAVSAMSGSNPVPTMVDKASTQKGARPSKPGNKAARGIRTGSGLFAQESRSDIITILPRALDRGTKTCERN